MFLFSEAACDEEEMSDLRRQQYVYPGLPNGRPPQRIQKPRDRNKDSNKTKTDSEDYSKRDTNRRYKDKCPLYYPYPSIYPTPLNTLGNAIDSTVDNTVTNRVGNTADSKICITLPANTPLPQHTRTDMKEPLSNTCAYSQPPSTTSTIIPSSAYELTKQSQAPDIWIPMVPTHDHRASPSPQLVHQDKNIGKGFTDTDGKRKNDDRPLDHELVPLHSVTPSSREQQSANGKYNHASRNLDNTQTKGRCEHKLLTLGIDVYSV